MHSFTVYGSDDTDKWLDSLAGCREYDIYHLPAYHALAQQRGEGQARLAVYRQGRDVIAIPLLLRSVSEVQGLAESGANYQDATTVYGYPGPVSSRRYVEADETMAFWQELHEYLVQEKVVAAFSRLNPLFDQVGYLRHGGEVLDVGPTVSIDLLQPESEQLRHYRSSLRYDITQARNSTPPKLHRMEQE